MDPKLLAPKLARSESLSSCQQEDFAPRRGSSDSRLHWNDLSLAHPSAASKITYERGLHLGTLKYLEAQNVAIR